MCPAADAAANVKRREGREDKNTTFNKVQLDKCQLGKAAFFKGCFSYHTGATWVFVDGGQRELKKERCCINERVSCIERGEREREGG